MNQYGKIFKILREAKNMSLKEVAGDFVTPAQLSRFENGKSNLSVDTFFKCLRRMDVLQGEFSTFYHLYYQDEDVRLSLELKKALEHRNTNYFKKQIKEYQNRFDIEGRKSDRVLIAVFHVMMQKCDTDYLIPKSERQVIADYLLSIDEWCFYEIWILGHCASSLNTKLLDILCSELVGRTQFYHGILENRRRVYRIALNIIGNLLDRGEERIASKIIRSIENLDLPETDMIERLHLKFSKGHLNHLQGNPKGINMMSECKKVSDFLDCDDFSQQIEDTLSRLTDM